MPDFLNPIAIAVAAGATVPPLVALYFLKLKRSLHIVPSTFLWKRAVEDLHVNSPFQRLRRSLLLLLQLLALICGAVALGVPMCEQVEKREDTLILLLDQSASMSIIEDDGRTRLDRAKTEAQKVIDDMTPGSRALIVAFCDRASVVSSFESDKAALKERIQQIEQTQSTSTLSEALRLAEAYSQNIIIGASGGGADVAPKSTAPPADVFIYTDGRIADGEDLAVENLNAAKMEIVSVGQRSDNVGILTMETRRQYERPDVLQVFAGLRNFGPEPVEFDAALYLNDEFVDNQTVRLEGAAYDSPGFDPDALRPTPPTGSASSIAFDEVEFNEAGTVEVRLRIDDALAADNRAWTVVEPPRHVRVLLVTSGDFLMEEALGSLPFQLEKMLPSEFEKAMESGDVKLLDGERCRFDVVVFDSFSPDKLPQGNFFYWGAAPKIEGFSAGKTIRDERIFDWDDTHPILRHVQVAGIDVFQWVELTAPVDAVQLIKGQSSPVLAYLSRAGSQYLVSAFSLIVEDDNGNPMLNTYWVTKPHFIVFLQNAIQYLSSSLMATGTKSARPGDPVMIAAPPGESSIVVQRPDNVRDSIPSAGAQTLHYARTRTVGIYRAEPGMPGQDRFAVNLFDAVESCTAPRTKLSIGTETLTVAAGDKPTNRPAWPYVLLAMLGVLTLEWVVYNRRVFV